jgi:hypothetical protein
MLYDFFIKPMLRSNVRPLLLICLVVDVNINSVDLASGKSTQNPAISANGVFSLGQLCFV